MFVCCGLFHVKDNREEEVYVTLVTVCVCVLNGFASVAICLFALLNC